MDVSLEDGHEWKMVMTGFDGGYKKGAIFLTTRHPSFKMEPIIESSPSNFGEAAYFAGSNGRVVPVVYVCQTSRVNYN